MCDFNASEVLKLRREIECNVHLDWLLQASLIRDIDEARIKHQFRHECDCWQKALEAA